MPAMCQSRKEVQKAAPCLRLAKNRCGTQWRAESTAPGVRKLVPEPRKGLRAPAERIKCWSMKPNGLRKSQTVSHMGNVGVTSSVTPTEPGGKAHSTSAISSTVGLIAIFTRLGLWSRRCPSMSCAGKPGSTMLPGLPMTTRISLSRSGSRRREVTQRVELDGKHEPRV